MVDSTAPGTWVTPTVERLDAVTDAANTIVGFGGDIAGYSSLL